MSENPDFKGATPEALGAALMRSPLAGRRSATSDLQEPTEGHAETDAHRSIGPAQTPTRLDQTHQDTGRKLPESGVGELTPRDVEILDQCLEELTQARRRRNRQNAQGTVDQAVRSQ